MNLSPLAMPIPVNFKDMHIPVSVDILCLYNRNILKEHYLVILHIFNVTNNYVYIVILNMRTEFKKPI